MSYRLSNAAIYAIAGISLAAMGGTAMADVLVASSSGAVAREYPRGSRHSDNTLFVLQRGDSVTVLANGATRRFRGPGTYSANSERQLARSAAGTVRGSRGRARTGVSRGPGVGQSGALQHPDRNVWQIDISESGTVCYIPLQSMSLWRSSIDEPREITITRMSDQANETLAFDDGQASHAWPESFAASPGAEYRISWSGAIIATRIRFAELNAEPRDSVAVGEALFTNGCESQFDALVVQTENGTETTSTDG